MEIEASQQINAPAETVWEIITDLPGSPEVISAISSIEVLSEPGPFRVGTRWRETRTMFGREATEVMEVSSLVPGTSYTTVAASHGAHYESTMSVTEDGPGTCTLRMTFRGEPTSTVGRLMSVTLGRLFTGATRKAAIQDLSDIALAAEFDEGPAESGGRPAGP